MLGVGVLYQCVGKFLSFFVSNEEGDYVDSFSRVSHLRWTSHIHIGCVLLGSGVLSSRSTTVSGDN